MKDWGPQGYGKCNRKYSAAQATVQKGEMLPSRGSPIQGNLEGGKPYPMQDPRKAIQIPAVPSTGR